MTNDFVWHFGAQQETCYGEPICATPLASRGGHRFPWHVLWRLISVHAAEHGPLLALYCSVLCDQTTTLAPAKWEISDPLFFCQIFPSCLLLFFAAFTSLHIIDTVNKKLITQKYCSLLSR